MNILIVDDSGVMRRIHKSILMEHGIAESDIIEAEDGKAALEHAAAQHIGLFLVDWNMPKLNGLEFVRTTSEAARYNVVEAIQAGVTNYVVKPIKGNALFEKIGKFLQP